MTENFRTFLALLRTGRYQLQNILTFHNCLRATNGIPDFEHPNMIKHDIKWDRIVNIKDSIFSTDCACRDGIFTYINHQYLWFLTDQMTYQISEITTGLLGKSQFLMIKSELSMLEACWKHAALCIALPHTRER